MSIIEPATMQMIKNIIDGTTPPERAIADEDGKKFKDYYALKSELSSTVIETTITDLNSLPLESGIYRNEAGFTANVPSYKVYQVKQEVYKSDYISSEMTFVVQTASNFMNGLYQRTKYNLASSSGTWSSWKQIAESNGTIYATQAEKATKLANTTAIGSATKPVYIDASGQPVAINYELGAACEKGVSDDSYELGLPFELSSTDEKVPTVRQIYYGLPTINGSHSYNSEYFIYAPTGKGSTGQILRSSGSNIPGWIYPFSALSSNNSTPSTTETTWKKMYIRISSSQNLLFQWRRVNSSGSAAKHEAITFSTSYSATPAVFTTYSEIGNTSSVSNMYGWLSAVSSSGCTVRSYGGCAFWVLAIGIVNA